METLRTTISPASHAKTTARKRDRFFLTMSVIALVLVIAGFFPTYIAPVSQGSFIAKPYVHFHGLVFFFWILAGILQPLLVVTGHSRLHRRIGPYLAAYAALVLFMGVAMSFISVRVDITNGQGDAALSFLLIQLTDMLLFGVFVALAVYYYKKPDYHKRLMLLATVAILPAALMRLAGFMGVQSLFLLIVILESFVIVGILYDYLIHRKVHPVYLIGGGMMTVVHAGRMFLFNTEEWRSMASWLVS